MLEVRSSPSRAEEEEPPAPAPPVVPPPRRGKPPLTERRALSLSISVGAVVLVLVLVGGGLFAMSRPEEATATAGLIVVPSERVEREAVAGYYETLGNGQVVATYAEILRDRADGDERSGLSVAIRVVPSTALVEIAVSSEDEDAAVAAANELADDAVSHVDDLDQPYTLRQVNDAVDTEDTRTPLPTLLVVVLLVSVVAGLGAQQVVFQLLALQQRRRALAATG